MDHNEATLLSPVIPSPCYVLEEAKLIRNLELMQRVQQESGAEIILALKGFSMWSSFSTVRQYLAGCTASSVWEAELAADTFGKEVHAYSPAYKASEMGRLLELCNHISFNSITQLERYQDEAVAADVSVGIRINPEQQEAETELYDPSAPGSRLGIRAEQLEGVDLSKVEGFHVHNLCECNSFALERTLAAVEKNFEKYLPQLKWINLGGGHLMTRKGYDVEHLITQLKRLKEKYGVHVILEPGSAVAWQTGPLVCEVVDIVENQGKVLILDISVTAHMPDVLEMPYRPVLTFKGENGGEAGEKPFTYRIGGNSCLAGDVIPAYSFSHEIEIGDRLLFQDMMHYTMVKTSFFNGVEHPSIGILKADGNFELKRQFTYQDFKARLS
ncbi:MULTISPECIES: carboxynorspermidine decarboxylase [Gammaproteobacteria]|uniref:carboxynorspermidine decarboxylase n=1 Tax=Gammaproteobacteria TaxID=1236 RepID=UPI000DCF7CBB|nr:MULTISPECIES: carboxynorspermidine decarboxylase [Gammaproteobacteria]RTE87749.1 carboxynorspermidine decarboxylase [Aliidiomarina sp. B3213]TCZ92469.1 carboxynorspermidine decarboxylase [Lysobacter sp. N42]